MIKTVARRLPHRCIHMAVVGTGPAAFYTTKYLLRMHPDIRIDMIERLPTPFGLVRYGVAPDHPETKIVTNDFQETMRDPRCRFFGNVKIGRDVSIAELRAAYDGIVIASGAASEKSLGVPGEQLRNSITARAFVNWYNAHPDHAHDQYNLNVRDAIIIGNGNVALDVARILCCPHSAFQHTDMSREACDALQRSSIKRVFIVGRRGVAQASFTNKELREIVKKTSFQTFVDPKDLDMSLMSPATIAECNTRAVRRRLEILSKAKPEQDITNDGLHFRFNLQPVEFTRDPQQPDAVGGVVFERTQLSDHQVVTGTGQFQVINAGLVIRSVGYRSEPIDGVPFDDKRGIIPNQEGRVIEADGSPIPNLYVTGWIKRGPSGIIGSNIADAQETVAAIGADLRSESTTDADRDRLWNRIRQTGVVIVDKEMWSAIDISEIDRGQASGKPREKYSDWETLLRCARTKIK